MADNMPAPNEFRAGRADSTSSTSSTSSVTRRMSTGAATAPPPFRSSQHLFESLEAQKRKNDPVSMARRQSINEQKPAPGFIGRMWNKYVYLILSTTCPSMNNRTLG
ncbi:hypothetical protein VTJ49DRAFT_7276 [Mycothermus thermophilus]|uniref:Conidiation-specific protein 8 n=1 Tax=Humicola insolens TaxID=85995 RepID=A0ABR3VHF4_HUMIN